jgi:predicted dehydrogenase
MGILSVAHMHADGYVRSLAESDGSAQIIGFYHPEAETASRFGERRNVPVWEDPEALVAASDAVVVTAENAKHREFVEMALRAHKPVLCEKPLATSLEDGVAMVQLSRELDVPLYMALPVRFVPSVQDLRSSVLSGKIGRLLTLVGTNHGGMPGGWFVDRGLSGGGAVADHTSHVADIMRWIAESDVVSVYAEISDVMHQGPVDDSAILTLEFDNGVIATLDPSWSRLPGHPMGVDVTLEAVGTEGYARWDAFKTRLDLYLPIGDEPESTHRKADYGESMDAHLVEEFILSVEQGKPGPTIATGIDGLRALEVSLAAYQSAEQRAPVATARIQV